MRLSLRTLLAFEDNVFDPDHQRHLAQTISTQDQFASALARLRRVVQEPLLSVPGSIAGKEELDPNDVAAYLDHQMPTENVDRFENTCFASDPFLAEVASTHHLLSKVLGEPVQSNRDCRLRCYDLGRPSSMVIPFVQNGSRHSSPNDHAVSAGRSMNNEYFSASHQNGSKAANKAANHTVSTIDLSNVGSYSTDAYHADSTANRVASPQRKFLSPGRFVMLFGMIALLASTFFAFQNRHQILESDLFRKITRQSAPTTTPMEMSGFPATADVPVISSYHLPPPLVLAEPTSAIADGPSSVSPTNNTISDVWVPPISPNTVPPPVLPPLPIPDFNPTTPIGSNLAPKQQDTENEAEPLVNNHQPRSFNEQEFNEEVPHPFNDPFVRNDRASNNLPTSKPDRAESSEVSIVSHLSDVDRSKTTQPTPWRTVSGSGDPGKQNRADSQNEPVTAQDIWGTPSPFQYPSKQLSEVELESKPKKTSIRQSGAEESNNKSHRRVTQADNSDTESPSRPLSVAPLPSNVTTLPTRQTTSESREMDRTTPPVLGYVRVSDEPTVVFTATSSSADWQKAPASFSLQAEQYLLTLTPFRQEIELNNQFLIEMVCDTKLCVLPPDQAGVPGIFVDYGRLVIRLKSPSLQSAVPKLRIETEKTKGILAIHGTKSSAFVDTFAEMVTGGVNPSSPTRNSVRDSGKIGVPPPVQVTSIIGLLPDPTEKMSWQVYDQKSPIETNAQTSILLERGRSERGVIRHLPVWLAKMPLPIEFRELETACKKSFDQSNHDAESALTAMTRDSSLLVRAFAYRLWGDLGQYNEPLQVMVNHSVNEEPLRKILVQYFREVMKRDSESVIRLGEAIDSVQDSVKR